MLSHDTFADFPPMEELAPRAPRVSGLNYAALEARWNVNRRTLYRWKKLGVNLNSPQQVAAHVAAQNASSPAAVSAAIKEISKPL